MIEAFKIWRDNWADMTTKKKILNIIFSPIVTSAVYLLIKLSRKETGNGE